MKEYIIHGTTNENLVNILESKYIESDINKKGTGVLDKSQAVNQIFTQLLYRNLPNENTQYPHWFGCCIVLDKKILKDYPFYATCIGKFYNKFSDAFKKDSIDNKYIFIKSKGNLKKIPNLKKLKIYIEKKMEKYNPIMDELVFMHSHEILFGKKIPLKKYCKCIIYSSDINNEILKNISFFAEKLKIPIKEYGGYGLNNFIDLIEK